MRIDVHDETNDDNDNDNAYSFLGPPESTPQTASQSVPPFLQGSRWWPTEHASLRVEICSNNITARIRAPSAYNER